MWKQTKAKYHLVSEDSRPSMESVADDHPLIQSDLNTESTHETPNQSQRKNKGTGQTTTLAFKSTLHITFLLRLVAFTFYLTAFVLFALNQDDRTIPSQVFLSFALTRNIYVLFCHLLSKCVRVNISFRMDDVSKPKLPTWVTGKALPLLIDGVILVCLMILLPIGLKSTNGYWYFSRMRNNGFILAFVGMPFYFFGAFDYGRPSSMAIGGSFELSFRRNETKTLPGTPEMRCADVEAQLPPVSTQVDEHAQEISSNLL